MVVRRDGVTRPAPRGTWIRWGGPALSLLCAVHCAVLPVVMAVLPALGAVFHDEWFDWTMFGAAALAAGWAVKKQRPRAAVVAILSTGLVLVLTGLVRQLELLTHTGFVMVAVAQIGMLLEAKRAGRCTGHHHVHAIASSAAAPSAAVISPPLMGEGVEIPPVWRP